MIQKQIQGYGEETWLPREEFWGGIECEAGASRCSFYIQNG